MTTTAAPRPASDFDPLMLLEAVEEVARTARPVDPDRVAQRPWDRARALSARYASAPPARRIAEYLGLSWSEVLRIALVPPGRRERALGTQLGEDIQKWLTLDYIAFALRLVGGRLGLTTLSPAQYRGERTRMLKQDAGRWRHGGHFRLPNDDQIRTVAGSWDRALRLATLGGLQGRGGNRARIQPGSIVEIIERCYEHHGTEPTTGDAELFAKANGIPFPRRERGRPWTDVLREWKDGRCAAGLPVPAGPPPKALRPDYSLDVGAAREGERRRHKTWDDPAELAQWVAQYLADLSRGARASKRGYDAWARAVVGAPWSSKFDKYGGWSAVLAAARNLG